MFAHNVHRMYVYLRYYKFSTPVRLTTAETMFKKQVTFYLFTKRNKERVERWIHTKNGFGAIESTWVIQNSIFAHILFGQIVFVHRFNSYNHLPMNETAIFVYGWVAFSEWKSIYVYICSLFKPNAMAETFYFSLSSSILMKFEHPS